MKIHLWVVMASLMTVIGSGSPTATATAAMSDSAADGLQRIQYPGYPDQSYRDDRGYPGQPRFGYDGRGYHGPKWVPGQIVPGPLLNFVVNDWEERGLSRPPNGHQWFRVGLQFLLVRLSDRKIARILNFD